MAHFDGPWKKLSEEFFEEFLAFFFPKAHREVDWSRPIFSLNVELPPLEPGDAVGLRFADKVFRVVLIGEGAPVVFIHVEFQNQPSADFSERIFIYNCRIYNKYRAPVISFAILGDVSAEWRPTIFEMNRWDFTLQLVFPFVKLKIDCFEKALALEGHNVFAFATLTHLEVMNAANDPQKCASLRVMLLKRLKELGLTEKRYEALRTFIKSMIDFATIEELVFLILHQDDIWEVAMSTSESQPFEKPDVVSREIASRYFTAMAERADLDQFRRDYETQLRKFDKNLLVAAVQSYLEEDREKTLDQLLRKELAEILFSSLSRRFGDLPKWVVDIIPNAKTHQLKRLVDRAIDGPTLDYIFS